MSFFELASSRKAVLGEESEKKKKEPYGKRRRASRAEGMCRK